MRDGTKGLSVAIVTLLVVVGLAACGGGSDSSSSTSAEASGGRQGQGESGASSKQGKADNGEGEAGKGESGSGGGEAAKFTPEQHTDSGGGSAQYEVKGGDNSVQEFGQEAEPQEFDAAAAALHDFLDARAQGNWAAACSYMSKAVVESFEKLAAQAKQVEATDCAEILQRLTNPAAKQSMKAEAEKADVGSLRVEGDRSFVIYEGAEGTILAMPMANEGGDWKVSSLAGTPLD